jgi:G-rich domain on putative tyrosine kinase
MTPTGTTGQSVSTETSPHAVSPYPQMEEELNLGRYVRILRSYWLIILVGMMVGAIAGFVGASLRPVLFEGVTTILIGRSNSVVTTASSRALLENNSIAAQTLTEIGLPISPQLFVLNALVVEQLPGTNVMKVRVKLGDPVKAAAASRVLSQKAVELNRRVASDEGSAVRAQLKGLLEEATARLKSAETEHLRYEDQAQIELLKKDTERMIAERGDLLRLRIDIETEKARLAAAEEEIKKQERVYSLPRAVAAEAALQHVVERGSAAEATGEALRRLDETAGSHSKVDRPLATEDASVSNPNDERAKEAAAQKDKEARRDATRELERRIAAQSKAADETQDVLKRLVAPTSEADAQSLDLSHPFINPVYQTLSFQIATSRTRLAALQRQQNEMTGVRKLGDNRFGELSDLYRRTSELARLETNLDLARKIYSDLTIRYEQSRAESVGNMVQLQIVDEAVTPERPLSRKRAQAAALGFGVGMVVAGLAALAWGTRRDIVKA